MTEVYSAHLEEPLPLQLELPKDVLRLELASLVVHAPHHDSCPHGRIVPWVMAPVVVPMLILLVLDFAMVVYHHCCPCCRVGVVRCTGRGKAKSTLSMCNQHSDCGSTQWQ